jgi:AcrR family transcriptional regulator
MPPTRAKTPRKRPSQERSRATVDVILSATARVLVTEGFEAASTNRIARAAGVSVGSFYQYYPTREAAIADLVDRQADKMLGILSRELASLADAPLDRTIRVVVSVVFEAFAQDALLNKVLLQNLASVGRLTKLRDMETRAAQLIRVYLEVHRDRVRVRNFDVGALILVHLIDTLATVYTVYHAQNLDHRALADELADLVLRYVMKDTPGAG